MTSIVRPSQVYDFTAHARRLPTVPPPGDRIDAQLANHREAIIAVQEAVEKFLAEAAGRPVVDYEAARREARRIADEEVSDLRRQVLNAAGLLYEARAELGRVKADAERAREAADRAEARVAAAVREVREAAPRDVVVQAPGNQTLPTPVLYPFAGGPYAGDTAGATATAADYAQVSIDWAEFMDGNSTIPGNILAINAISGDHWSSRWWANRSATAFGMLAWWYQGAWPGMPPSTPNTPTGQPLPIGAMFFNTTTGTMMVWNGSTWVNAAAPQKGVTASLYYSATAGQTVFPLSVVDRHGHNYAFSATVPEGVEVYIDGAGRLEPQFDYTVDYPSSTVTLISPAPAGFIVTIDVMVPALALTPSGSANTMLVNPIVPDGTTTSFTGLTLAANGHPVAASKSEELYVSVDGVLQQPGASYTANAATITFVEAPVASSNVFIVWFGPPVLGGAGGDMSGYLPLTGGALSGPLTLLDPTAPAHAANKAYVDAHGGGGGGIAEAPSDGNAYLRSGGAWTSGGTLTGALTIQPTSGGSNSLSVKSPSGPSMITASAFSTSASFSVSAGTNAGLTLNKGNPVAVASIMGSSLSASRWSMVLGDGAAESGGSTGSNFTLSGYNDAGTASTFLAVERATGDVTVAHDPTKPLGVATKQYVDAHAGSGGGGTITAGSSPTSGFTAGQLLMSDGSLLRASTAVISDNAHNALKFGSGPIYLNTRNNVFNTLWFSVDGQFGTGAAWPTMGFNLSNLQSDGGIQVTTGGYIGFNATDVFDTTRPDIAFMRDGVGIAGFHNDAALTSPTALRAYNTLTDASNGEWAALDWQTTPNVLTIGTQANGTGTARGVQIQAAGGRLDYGVTRAGFWALYGYYGLIPQGLDQYLGQSDRPWFQIYAGPGGIISAATITAPNVDLTVQAVTAAATTSINRAVGENVVLTLGTTITSLAISGWSPSGTTSKLRLLINNTGGNSIAWPSGTKWPGGTAPTLSASGKTDIVLLMSDNAGTTIYGSVVGQDYR